MNTDRYSMRKYILFVLLLTVVIATWFYRHTHKTFKAQVEIINFLPSYYSGSNDLTEEYHLRLKMASLKYSDNLRIRAFLSKSTDAIMTELFIKSFVLSSLPCGQTIVESKSQRSSNQDSSFCVVYSDGLVFTDIFLYSGFKLKDKTYRLSLTASFLNDKGEVVKEYNLPPLSY
ncbi:MAG: hypothetical protein HY762_06375 [Planctomycetes bacterium]|nr:hypothetical protein [Planctomycetota bacterium]